MRDYIDTQRESCFLTRRTFFARSKKGIPSRNLGRESSFVTDSRLVVDRTYRLEYFEQIVYIVIRGWLLDDCGC